MDVLAADRVPVARLRRARRALVAPLVLAMLLGLLTFATSSPPAEAQECPEGSVLSSNGVTCELDVSTNDSVCPPGQELDAAGLLCVAIPTTEPGAFCPEGQQLDAAGLLCEDIPLVGEDEVCPAGQELDEVGLNCVDIELPEGEEPPPPACDPGYSLGADGETCIADGPECDRGEVLDDTGDCVRTFQCPDGLILRSDLLGCISDGCPDDELLSVDGQRCVAPDSACPDGSPRPIGGACLVVETIEGEDGETEVVVRCAEADQFCQARVKQCAEGRGAGAGDEDAASCSDPRSSCEDDDDECEASNDRLVESAIRDGVSDDPVAIARGSSDPCDDLCPRLHRLDASGECVEFLDPTHPCVAAGAVPRGVTTNAVLDSYSYLAGLGSCVTRSEFLRRLGNFEAAAGAEADALTLLRETTSSYLTIEGQLEELDELLTQAQADVEAFTEAAIEADLQRANSLKLLQFVQKELLREQALLAEEALQVYVVGGNDDLIDEAVLSATNVTEISVAQLYGRVLLDDQVANITRVDQLKEQTESLRVALERAVREVEASLDSAVASAEGLERLQREAEALRADQLERRDQEAQLVADLRENKASFAQELGIFEQATLEINAIIEQTEFRVTTFAEFDGLFGNPIFPVTRITSNFGPRLHPILGYVRPHNGVDISAHAGEEILAVGPGVVQISRSFGGYGQTVVIDHGGDLLTLYAHMSVLLVEEGEELELGDTIGLVGSTGLSTGPHLHFEVWEDRDVAVDPRPYLTEASG